MSQTTDEQRFYEEHAEAKAQESVADLIYEFAVIRGDLTDGYARDQLVDLLERKIRQAEMHGARR